MTKTLRALALAGAAFAFPAQALAAQAAQAQCLAPAEVRALTSFAMPSALTGLIDHCTPTVGTRSFMATQGRSLVATYAARKAEAWPLARKAFFRVAAGQGDQKDVTAAMQQMPDSALQPFVEGMIGGVIGAKLEPGQCVLADKLMRLLAPLPPENTAELVGTIFELAGADKKAKPAGLTVCKS